MTAEVSSVPQSLPPAVVDRLMDPPAAARRRLVALLDALPALLLERLDPVEDGSTQRRAVLALQAQEEHSRRCGMRWIVPPFVRLRRPSNSISQLVTLPESSLTSTAIWA